MRNAMKEIILHNCIIGTHSQYCSNQLLAPLPLDFQCARGLKNESWSWIRVHYIQR